jgi:hypothetical protein
MKKSWLIIIVALIIIIPIAIFLFYPLCNFHTIGSKYPDSDGCNTCECSIIGSWCTLKGCLSPQDYENLQLSNIVTYLESCYAHLNDTEAQKDLDMSYCTNEGKEHMPSKEKIEILKSIQNIKGVEVCFIPGAGAYNISSYCPFNLERLKDCNEMFNITYSRLGVRPHYYSISVYKCDKNYYLHQNEVRIAGPPWTYIYKIDPNDYPSLES